ncbi:gamma-glutamyl-gamma-aminobutyrate hydrolase family protein [Streptococcus gallolyticus]|uniref:gamma-glutamyl-gamma-aminobutyrate hydrolase family protein n=1 Tax=Streptococcus hepaticus TaxID=3349163 RepID=UPI001C94BBE0|nr:gamma-glutamyl-gamma-aminobutyrate hydrolase family protein [Streptococcus gallolyticus]MBY5041276.1 gamma-glutamyl-gamma-aminobutyrate hydrolase family protein [Streptococcus gallolyticus]
MKQVIIGITGNQFIDKEDKVSPRMSYCATGFAEAVREAGGLPIVMPLAEPKYAAQYVAMIDKLILTGGQNVLPHFYNEEQTIISDDYLLERDLFELELIKEARLQNKPILAICRGLQLFNVAMGGSLHQDIPSHWQEMEADLPQHQIDILENTVLSAILGKSASVNSFHHQAIKDLATNLTVIATSSQDGIIEAITTNDGRPFLGVQWHPELMRGVNSQQQAIFDYFVQKL